MDMKYEIMSWHQIWHPPLKGQHAMRLTKNAFVRDGRLILVNERPLGVVLHLR